jgi:murein DD-endopeptidase MepM/ murein hydrolase activator NlpD
MRVAALLGLASLLAAPAPAQEVVRRVGRVTFRVDVSQAFPGGVVAVRLSSRSRLGGAWALLDGRRAPCYLDRGGARALGPGGAADVESRTDALQGERHRGLDYAVSVGTPVRAPAAGTVLLAGRLALSGETVVIDHGQGVLSVLLHLSRVDVRPGDAVLSGAVVGLSGDTGLAPEPMLEWRVYLHGVAVDPNALAALL